MMTEMYGTMLNWNHLVSNPTTGLERSLGLHKVEVPKISRQSAHESGKVVSPTHRQPFPPRGISLVLIYVRSPVDLRAGKIKRMKNPNDPIGY
jgi:hypothetical protein